MSANQNGFWGVYMQGQERPYIYDNHTEAKAKCLELASVNIGFPVWLLKCEVVGSVTKPNPHPVCTGALL